MSCEHCGMNCTEVGEDMSLEVFEACLLECDEMLPIGGGGPTIHPEFNNFLLKAIGAVDYVWLATNGSMTETALTLAKLAKRGVIGCALSLDE